ncbi:MAG: metalloregulator ArsR/SmtB family transcription factor [Planctomycetota bacterium]
MVSRFTAASIRSAAPLFSAMGDPTRLSLVVHLTTSGPESISSLSEGSNVSRQAITKHLRILGDAGLVRSSRHGREHIWQLDPSGLATARRYLDRIDAQWDAAISRLRGHVEDE